MEDAAAVDLPPIMMVSRRGSARTNQVMVTTIVQRENTGLSLNRARLKGDVWQKATMTVASFLQICP